MLQATPFQLVFECDIILNAHFISYWEDISRPKQYMIEKITKIEIKITNSKVIY